MSLRWTQGLASGLMKAIGSPVVPKTGGSLAPDDFFELFMLARAMRLAGARATLRNLNSAGAYVVTASPSASWTGVSYLDMGTAVVRSGFEVGCADGETAEIDLGVLALAAVLAAVRNGGTVASVDVRAAVECKDHGRRASRTIAHEVLGKTHRLRRRTPGVVAPTLPGNAPDVALASRSGVTPSASAVLAAEKIDCLDASTPSTAAHSVDGWLRTRI
jgi:hypothetical protein